MTEASDFHDFGKLIHPLNDESRGFVVFFPPAVGDHGQQEQEARFLAELGITSLLYLAPYLRGLNASTEASWQTAKIEMDEILFYQTNIVLVGKNLGGSFASFCFREEYKGLVVSGSIPFLSKYNSKIRGDSDPRFDLATTQLKIRRPALFQLGRQDEWIDEKQSSDLLKVLFQSHRLEWLDDGHEMNGTESRNQRLKFITEQLILSRP